MDYFISFLEEQHEQLTRFLFATDDRERIAFGFARTSTGRSRKTLLVREVWAIADEEIVSADLVHVSVRSRTVVRALRHAEATGSALVLVHSHPRHESTTTLSEQDLREERALFRTAFVRNGTPKGADLFGSVVFGSPTTVDARVWSSPDMSHPVRAVKVIGNRLRWLAPAGGSLTLQPFFDRQVRAFGPDIQRLLSEITVGVVGAGGIGSAVIEQLARLGVGRLIVFDPDRIEPSNVSRIYGARVSDAHRRKVKRSRRHVQRIGLGTRVTAVPGSIVWRANAELLLDCDIVFGCTDDHLGRAILDRLAIFHHVPVIDGAVEIGSKDGKISYALGRVTTVFPGAACLRTRGRISPDAIRGEAAALTDPEEAAKLRREGYVPALAGSAPAVITFTTAVAAQATSDLLRRLTGFMGERKSTESMLLFDEGELRHNSRPPSDECLCGDRTFWGHGDRAQFLDMLWPDGG